MNLTSFLQNKQLTIALTGEIDHHCAKEFIRVIGTKIDLYLPKECILDFREVAFMDSSGIAVVINTIRRMREIDGIVKLQNVSQQPLKVLLAAGIEKIVELKEESHK